MSEYKRFDICTLCRTKIMLKKIQDKQNEDQFEVTFLLNSMLLSIMQVDQNNTDLLKLEDKKKLGKTIKNCCDKVEPLRKIQDEKILHKFRNGLAHLRIKAINDGKIIGFIIWDYDPKRNKVPKGESEFDYSFEKASIKFTISVEKLYEVVYQIIDMTIEKIADKNLKDFCKLCSIKKKCF